MSKAWGRAILIVGWLALVGWGVAAADRHFEGPFQRHLLGALASTLLLLFAHLWTLFYLLGLGRAVERTAAEAALSPQLVAAGRGWRRRVVPSVLLAIGLALALFATGGAAYTHAFPTAAHVVTFILAAGAQVLAFREEARALRSQDALVQRVGLELSGA